ncbi:hypothetical protein OAO87_02275 [bacterium]|nr:hypothetical protein [bacterium]
MRQPGRLNADEWLAASLPGHCGETAAGDRGDCYSGDRGNLGLADASNWTAAVEACLVRCARCARCRYVSLSLKWRDCSWYHECTARSREVFCFRSGAVAASDDVHNSPGVLAASAHASAHANAHAKAVAAVGSRVVILQASDRPPPPPLAAVVERTAAGIVQPRVGARGGIRALTAAVNRVYAAAHGHAYVYARIVGGCGRGLSAWCQLPAALALLLEFAPRDAVRASLHDTARDSLPHATRHHRFSWVLAIDEDVAFSSAISFAAFVDSLASPRAARTLGGSEDHRPPRRTCHGRCQPPGSVDLSDTTCSEDLHVAEEQPPCLTVAKEIDGWPGVNVGSRFYHNSRSTLNLIREWCV